MKLIYEITVYPLVSPLGLYLILNLVGTLLIRGQRLKKGGAYFKVREIHHIKFQKFFFVIKTSIYQQQVQGVYIIISYELIWILVLLLLEKGNFADRWRIIRACRLF